jgi:hypothetical protein
MRECPVWRTDVLDYIADAMQRTRMHALVAHFRERQATRPDMPMDWQLSAFRRMCQTNDEVLPDEHEAMLELDRQLTQPRK